MEKSKDRIKKLNQLNLLKLYNRLKKVIYRADSIDDLLNEVCNVIASHIAYHSAWIILSDNGKISSFFKSENVADHDLSELNTACYKLTIKTNNLVVIGDKDKFCKNCRFRGKDESIVFSTPLVFKNFQYGTIAANVSPEYGDDEEHFSQFKELAEDISYAIYNIILEKKLKKEREALILSQNRMKSLLSASPNAVIISDLNMNITFVSERTKELFEGNTSVGLDKILNKYIPSEILPKDEYIQIVSNFNNLVSKKIDFVSSVYHPNISGLDNISVKLYSTAIADEHGEVNGIISVVEDYSLTERNNKRLNLYNRKFSTIFEEAPTGIFILDDKSCFIDSNKMGCELLEYSKEELIGKRYQDFFSNDSAFAYQREELIKAGTLEIDVAMVKKNGEEIIVRNNVKTIVDEGELIGFVVHSKDITAVLDNQKRINTLSQVVDQSPSIVTVTDLDGNLTYVNSAFEKVTGYSFDDVKGKNPRILKSDYHNDKFYKALWKKISHGREWKGRFKNIRKDGHYYWEYAVIKSLLDEKGNAIAYIKSGEDISSLIKAEEKLNEINRKYQNIFELVPLPIAIHQNGIIIDANKAAIEFSKAKDKEEFIGTKLLNYVHKDSIPGVLERLQIMKETNLPAPMSEAIFYNTLGEIRFVNVVSSPYTYDGELAYMVAFMDITEKKEWLKKLKESEAKFKSIFNSNPSGISISTVKDGKYYDVNGSFSSITGYSKEEVIGKSFNDISIFVSVEEKNKFLQNVSSEGWIDNEEFRFRIKDNSIITALVSAIVVEINREDMLLVSITDITDRKQIEKELVEAKLKAEENDKLKSAFLANMSHEIRTPMNAIIGFSDLLKDDNLSHEEQVSYIDIIQSKSEDLMLLINDIIDISKIESGSLEVECIDINVFDFLNSLKNEFTALVANKSHRKVKFIVNNTTDYLQVRGDPHRLNQVFYNLISNSIKFTQEGEISISVEEADESVKFYVSDTGIGIPNSKFDVIFDRFSQVNYIEDALIGGTGLGLSITRSLVNMMKGSISVESEIGKGSTFIVTMSKSLNSDTSNILDGINKVQIISNLENKMVVVLEDDEASRAYIGTLLKGASANYHTFDILDTFIEWFKKQSSIDVLIIDTKFINVDSMECFKEFKAKFPNVAIIGVSGNIVQNYHLDKVKLKLDAFVSKPFTKADMYKAINRVSN